MDNGKLTILAGDPACGGLTEKEGLLIREKLFSLLAERTERFTAGDSSSVPEEIAGELLTSVCYTVELYLRVCGTPLKRLADADMGALFRAGIRVIEERMEEGKRLYRAACLGVPEIESRSLSDTLISIGGFFKRYDYRFFAQRIPCDIDYQLFRPVPDSMAGVEYVNEYLRRVILENDLLRRFDPGREAALLERHSPDYRGLLINLYEPVAAVSMGLVLADEGPLTLALTDAGRDRILQRLRYQSKEEVLALMEDAAERLCGVLSISDGAARTYLCRTAEALCPRILAALPHGRLEGVFP